MSAPKREQNKNDSASTLDGGIDASQTTIDVHDGSQFPSVGNFRLRIGNELLKVTARSGDTLTVVRGIEGFAADSHSDSAAVTMIVTADSFDRNGKDNVTLWGSNAPPLNTIVDVDGITPLTTSDFSWENQGGATAADQHGTILFRCPPSGSNSIRSFLRSLPSAPWTWTAAIDVTCFADDGGTQNNNLGVCLRESGTGKIYLFGFNRSSTTSRRLLLEKWSGNASFSATPWKNTNPIFSGPLLWTKIVDNNTNLIFSLSSDGIEWTQIFSESRTTFMSGAPNQFGLSSNNGSNGSGLDGLTRLVHSHFA